LEVEVEVVEIMEMKEISVMKCRVERCWSIFDLE
jgi:hypothetical protein